MGLDDNNLEREEVEVESAQLVNNGPVDSFLTHIIIIKVGRYTFGGQLLVEIFWWNLFEE